MPKYPRTFLTITLILGAWAPAQADAPADPAVYERIKSLAGDWSGRMEDPLAGPPVNVRYEVVSGGKAVIEYQNPGQSFEMVTVYYLADGKLRATHYCGAGNQPAYKLGPDSTADLVKLDFDGGSGFDPKHDGHVHKGEIRFVAPDRIEHRWFHYIGTREQGATHWFLERQAAVPAAPAPATPPTEPPASPPSR
ncbi:MAG: hypothetical protein WD793_14915 [Steroidobacteraceae bacterium]